MPIYERLYRGILESDVIHEDETTKQVLHELDREVQRKSYMWLYRASGDVPRAIVFCDYRETRSDENLKAFLAGFSGFFHTDGWYAYHNLADIIIVGCRMKRWEFDLDFDHHCHNPLCQNGAGEFRICEGFWLLYFNVWS